MHTSEKAAIRPRGDVENKKNYSRVSGEIAVRRRTTTNNKRKKHTDFATGREMLAAVHSCENSLVGILARGVRGRCEPPRAVCAE